MLAQLFLKVLSEYPEQVLSPLKGNPLADLLRHELPDMLSDLARVRSTYDVQGSPGKGNWAEVPWVGVFDKSITSSAETGYYIVYLFDAEMRGVFLSLNQGWVQYEEMYGIKDGRIEIQKTAGILKKTLRSALSDFNFDPIDLHAGNNLGRGYELGHICGKYYSANAFPNDEVLIDDLRNLMGVYRELKGYIGNNILSVPHLENSTDTVSEPLPIFSEDIPVRSLELLPVERKGKNLKGKERVILFNEEAALLNQRKHKRIGDSAEQLVYQYERRRLEKEGRPDLADKVQIVSQDMAKGFDILSFELDGSERQIEVKGTPSVDMCTFFLTAHELENSVTLQNYHLFIVHGIGSKDVRIEFIRKPNFSSDLFLLDPRQYLVRYEPKTSESLL